MKVDEVIEEGWKSAVGAGLIGSALALGGSMVGKFTSDDNQGQRHVSGKVEKPYHVPQIKNPKTPKEFLIKAAVDSGIEGDELASLLAQAAHETMGFKRLSEVGDKKYFRKYDPRHNPRLAKILGNTKPGDGEKFKGRSYLQITGRWMYTRIGKALGLPLDERPELLDDPEIGAKASIWYWNNRVKSKVTDFTDTHAVTRPINAGLSGIDDRLRHHAKMAKKYGTGRYGTKPTD